MLYFLRIWVPNLHLGLLNVDMSRNASDCMDPQIAWFLVSIVV